MHTEQQVNCASIKGYTYLHGTQGTTPSDSGGRNNGYTVIASHALWSIIVQVIFGQSKTCRLFFGSVTHKERLKATEKA